MLRYAIFLSPLFLFVDLHGLASTSYTWEQTGQIIGVKGTLSYEKRYHTVHTSPESVFLTDSIYFLQFLNQTPDESELTEDELASLKNDIADILIRLNLKINELGKLFLEQVESEAQGELWRSYALQKIGPVATRVAEPSLSAELIEYLKNVAMAPESANSGVAFIGLANAAKESDLIESVEVARMSNSILVDGRFDMHTRGVAMTTGAEFGEQLPLDYARKLIRQADTPFPMRVASIATLGIAGDQSDATILQKFTISPDIRISHAADYALKTIRKRSTQ